MTAMAAAATDGGAASAPADGGRELHRLSVDELRRITDLGHVHRLLAEVEEAEMEIDRALHADLGGRHGLQLQLESLDALRPRLALVLGDVARLRTTVVGTSKLAEAVSAKVRQLDVEQSRVQLAISELENIQELKHCVSGVRDAIASANYETAAVYIHRYLSFDPKVARMVLVDGETSSTDIMRAAEQDMRAIILREFAAATKTHDADGIVRFFKLFPLLRMASDGLERFADYCAARLEQEADAEFREIRIGAGGSPFAVFLTRLFERVANRIDEEEPLVETHYSPGHMMTLLERLQRAADKQMQRAVAVFMERVGVDRLLAGRAQNAADLKQLDLIVAEIAQMMASTQLFLDFMEGRVQAQLDVLAVDKAAQREQNESSRRAVRLGAHGWATDTPTAKRLQDLVGTYLAAEELFMRRSVEKALRIDERDADMKTSSAVDDAFYIFGKCGARALATGSVDALCAIVNITARVFEDDLLAAIRDAAAAASAAEDALAVSLPTGALPGAAGGGAGGAAAATAQLITALNNADVACDYIARLRGDLAGRADSALGEESIARQKVEAVLSVLGDAAGPAADLASRGVSQLFAQTLQSDLRGAIADALRDAPTRYALAADDYEAAYASGTEFGGKLIAEFARAARPLAVALTDSNYARLVGVALTYAAKELERVFVRTRVSGHGALLIERGVRMLVGHFAQWGARDRLARLLQIASVLNVDRVAEAPELWATGSGGAWRITLAEFKQILALRNDFAAEEVARLRL